MQGDLWAERVVKVLCLERNTVEGWTIRSGALFLALLLSFLLLCRSRLGGRSARL
ncbi:uncharacterized protein BDZ99DRAFT_153669 [Mytilinidion resinicola]|uniref:Uncharacterized protein n=1 Tax=Mytilinidion resinicola TaxID=574789 RepID=A0A6A6Y861_9PEZI|nr:uncharacterized protein BDZ99DRAFT_153669 [Mytilinidion resinicola]KAF2804154.1 hypothetical protein BDZ99DRAFT_153669 [Mytilinidion resinicola]